MPAFSLSVNGQSVATVDTSTLDQLHVHLFADRRADQFAGIEIHGGRYPVGEPSTFLIWLSEWALEDHDLVTVAFEESGSSTVDGKTIAELFPDQPAAPEDFRSTDEMRRQAQARPLLRSGYAYAITPADGDAIAGETSDAEDLFTMSCSWDSSRPDAARVSVHAAALADSAARKGLAYRLSSKLQAGQSVSLRVSSRS